MAAELGESALELWDALRTLSERRRTAMVLRYWADLPVVEAWVSADGCLTFGLSVTGGSPDQNALAASELAFFVVEKAGLDPTEQPAIDCPDPVAEPGSRPAMFFYCPFDDVDQIPRPVASRDPNVFFMSPTEALQAVFSTDPRPGGRPVSPSSCVGPT